MSKDDLITKLAKELKNKKGIDFKPVDELGRNVVFWSADYEKKICHDQFYRHSGIYSYKVMTSEHEFKLVPMSDEMFYLSFMRTIIEYAFNHKTK